jgi:hypothetical protein
VVEKSVRAATGSTRSSKAPSCPIMWEVDISEIQAAFDDVFDQAVVFHGFADYMRDYDVSST